MYNYKKTLKHASKELKEEYIKRYFNGESLAKLGNELYKLGYTKQSSVSKYWKEKKYVYPGISLIANWVFNYKKDE
ncbi:MAG: hypothetical protein LBV53_03045 [Mycoplasmataceae bacterium]|nr:hypothetical protein [Mycoplasmataceae bacterium]